MSIFKNNGKEIDNYLNHWTETGKTVNFSLRSLSPFSTVNRTTIKKQGYNHITYCLPKLF